MQAALERLLEKRRDKAIATVMGIKDREIDDHIPPELRKRFRKVILDQFNSYHEAVMEVASALDGGDVVLNEEYLDRIDDILDTLVRIESRVIA